MSEDSRLKPLEERWKRPAGNSHGRRQRIDLSENRISLSLTQGASSEEQKLTLDDFLSTVVKESKEYKAFIESNHNPNSIDEERLIIEDAGVPQGVIEAMRGINSAVGGMITVRTGTPPLDTGDLQAKPLLVHAKCGNKPLGILSGLICTDPILSKIHENSNDRSKDVEQAREAIEKDLKGSNGIIKELPLKLTLREILSKTSLPPNTEGSMAMDRVVDDEGKKFLILKYNQGKGFGPPDNDVIEFRIQLDPLPTSANTIQSEDSVLGHLRAFVDGSDEIFNEVKIAASKSLDEEFAIEYRTSLTTGYQNLKVLGMHDQKITGDVDLDYYSIPMGLPTDAYKAINCLEGIEAQRNLLDNTESLLKSSKYLRSPLHSLYEKLNKTYKDLQTKINPSETQKELTGLNDFFNNDPEMMNYFARLTGIISPVEFLQSIAINILYNSKNIDINNFDNMKKLYNPIQHGAENRSPHKGNAAISSGAEGKRLHVIYDDSKKPANSRVFYTFTDEQRAKLCLTDGFLEKNFVHINPSSNMELWGPVVEKQIKLEQQQQGIGIGPKVDEETKKAYNQYIVGTRNTTHHTGFTR